MSSNSDTNWGRLCEFVGQVVARKRIPGVAVGLLHAGELNTAGFGVTSVENPLPVTDSTLFQIGSITKTFVGTAMMRLVEMGELDLDATVRTYLPDFRVADEDASAQVTVRHLLVHMGGWEGDFFYDTGAGDDALAKYVVLMADLEQLAPIGTVWSYNNAGFIVAGRIVEVVTGKRFEEALRELVLEPLGLNRTFFNPADVLTHRFVVGHDVTGEEPQVARPWAMPHSAYPAGGITCDVRDLMRYARFHLGDGVVPDEGNGEAKAEGGTRLLSLESMAQMRLPQATVWKDEAWGLSWTIDDIGGTRQVSHGGGTLGQVSQLTLLPERDLAVAVLTNADQGGMVTQAVVKWALREYLGLEQDDPAPIEASREELAQYVGHYSNPFSDVDIGLLGGRLVGQTTYKKGFPDQDSPPLPSPPPASLAMCEKDRLLVMDGPDKGDTAEIVRKPDGSIGWLRVERIHVREE
jgi:CubicO group peptidase (beta-lactamase class C family)